MRQYPGLSRVPRANFIDSDRSKTNKGQESGQECSQGQSGKKATMMVWMVWERVNDRLQETDVTLQRQRWLTASRALKLVHFGGIPQSLLWPLLNTHPPSSPALLQSTYSETKQNGFGLYLNIKVYEYKVTCLQCVQRVRKR